MLIYNTHNLNTAKLINASLEIVALADIYSGKDVGSAASYLRDKAAYEPDKCAADMMRTIAEYFEAVANMS